MSSKIKFLCETSKLQDHSFTETSSITEISIVYKFEKNEFEIMSFLDTHVYNLILVIFFADVITDASLKWD